MFNETMKLWTAWLNYYDIGKGQAMMAIIGHAPSAHEFKELFYQHFETWREYECEVEEGIINNIVTNFLFSHNSLSTMDSHSR